MADIERKASKVETSCSGISSRTAKMECMYTDRVGKRWRNAPFGR